MRVEEKKKQLKLGSTIFWVDVMDTLNAKPPFYNNLPAAGGR